MDEDDTERDDDYDPEVEVSAALKKLCGVLSAAGFDHRSGPANWRQVLLLGQHREWLLHARLDAEWFHVTTNVGKLPADQGLRSELLLWLARENNKSCALLKYSVSASDTIVLEFYMRSQLLTYDDVRNSIWFLHSTAERDYVPLIRIASGEARLSALSKAFSANTLIQDGPVSQ